MSGRKVRRHQFWFYRETKQRSTTFTSPPPQLEGPMRRRHGLLVTLDQINQLLWICKGIKWYGVRLHTWLETCAQISMSGSQLSSVRYWLVTLGSLADQRFSNRSRRRGRRTDKRHKELPEGRGWWDKKTKILPEKRAWKDEKGKEMRLMRKLTGQGSCLCRFAFVAVLHHWFNHKQVRMTVCSRFQAQRQCIHPH